MPEGEGVIDKLKLSGVIETERVGSLERVAILSSALESPGMRRREPKIKATRREPAPTKSVRKVLWALVWERLSLIWEVWSLTGDMRLRKKVGIDLKKRARDFKHLERERERESSSLSWCYYCFSLLTTFSFFSLIWIKVCYLHLRMMRESFIVLMVNVSLARGEINVQVGFWKKFTKPR